MLPAVSSVMPSMPRPVPKSCSTVLLVQRAVGLHREGDQVAIALRVVVGDIDRLAVGRDENAVGLLHVARGDLHVAVGDDEKHGFEVQLARLVAHVPRIGEIDVALAVDRQVVGAVEPLAVELVGQRLHRAVLRRRRCPS